VIEMAINFRLDPASGVPFYRQVIDQTLAGIATGALAPGEQLPTVRTLAVELQVNLNTVAKAYKELEIRGVLTTQQGSGTYVAPVQVERDEVERRRLVVQLADEFLARAAAAGLPPEEVLAELTARVGERKP
jgi:GntR family transcriptional regulator